MKELGLAEFLSLKAKRDNRRCPVYCLRLLKALFDTEAVKEIGFDAAMLVLWVASREDELRYRDPVRAWNTQLDNMFGYKSRKQLNRSRTRAIESGWLFYHREHDRSIGQYFAVIPERFHESASFESVPKTEQEAEQESNMCSENGTGSGTGSGTPSNPNPIPSPSKRTADRFIPPSVQDVREFAKAASFRIDAERFVDYFASVGWVVGKGRKPMKSWQAAARNWSRDSKEQEPQTEPRKLNYV